MDMILENLIDECHIVEYKAKVTNRLFESISAMSNTDGGCIILGVEDETKKIVGVDLSNSSQERIVNQIVDINHIQPRVELYTIEGKNVLKIIIDKASFPVQYKGVFYKRVGNSTRVMSVEEQKKLLLKDTSWDSIINNCTIDDIDMNTISRFVNLAVEENRLSREAQTYNAEQLLESLGLLINGKLTNGAILLFGKNPQKLFNHATIRIGLFKGNDEENMLDDKIIMGNLFQQISSTEVLIKSLIKVKYSVKDLSRNEYWTYPLVAVREALLNAIVHRDYFDYSSNIQIKIFDNSIWFYNSGELFGGLTIEQLKSSHHPSKSRNPLIVNTIYKAGFIEAFGTGIRRMTIACQRQGLPVPEFENSTFGFVLKMNRNHAGLNDRQNRAIEYILENGQITNSVYQEINHTTRETSKRDLKRLVELGIIVASDSSRAVKYTFKTT